jgi:hypothetical protein
MSPPAAASTRPTDPRPARIEVLYFDGCPNHEPVIERIRELIDAERHPAVIELVHVDSDAEAHTRRFLGSPTVRIDGADIEPGADQRTDYGLNCRLYRTPAGLARMPDDATLRAAFTRTSQRHQAPAARSSGSA